MLETLILCMALDYLTGMMAAGIFHKSKKSAEGGLESRSGWKGLCRKGISLLIVLVSYRLDLIAGTNFICNAVIHHRKSWVDGCAGAKGIEWCD